MSQEINFYLALENKEGKLDFFPNLFHYDDELELVEEGEEAGKWKVVGKTKKPSSIEWYCGYEMEDIGQHFNCVSEEDLSEEMAKAFTYTDWNGNKKLDYSLKSIPVEEFLKLNSDYIRKGYFLAKDVGEYEETGDAEDLFFDHIGPLEYSNLATKRIKRETYKDEYGDEYTRMGYEDYMYFAYPDYHSQEYLIHRLKIIINTMSDLLRYEHIKGDKKIHLLMNIC